MRPTFCIHFVVTFLVSWAAAIASTTSYTIIEIPTLGGSQGEALGVNNLGHVVGWAELPSGDAHAFFWDGVAIVDLGTLGGNVSYAYDINDAGRIVGQSEALAVPSVRFGFYIDPGDGAQTALANLPNTFNAVVRTVNQSGDLAGASLTIDELDAVIWSQAGNIQPLASFLDEPFAQGDVWDSNDSGDRVGWSKIFDLDTGYVGMRAALWPSGSNAIVEIETLGGNFSQARGINNAGQVVGMSGLAVAQAHAFLWKGGSIQDLGDLGDGTLAVFSVGQDVNDAAQVVGYSQFEEFSSFRGFVWENGAMDDLNALVPAGSGWELTHANAINDVGQIVGRGISPSGLQRAFLLTPGGTLGPPRVPADMTVGKLGPPGADLFVEWDAIGCPGAVDHQIVFGSAPELLTPSGAECGIGSASPYAWLESPGPAGLLWWIVVATDGDATEGSWGVSSDGVERNAGNASLECGAVIKDLSNGCR